MRIAVLILAIIGALASAALGMKWISDTNKFKETLDLAQKMGVDMSEMDRLLKAAYALLAGSALAIVGGVLAMMRKGKIAAPVLGLAVLVPAVLTPKTLLATFFLAIAAGLSLLVKPMQA